jgi:hypothetical protein
MMLERRGPGAPIGAMAEELGDRLRAANSGVKSYIAAVEYPVSERLPLVKQATLVLRLKDELWEHSGRVRASLSNGTMLDVPDYGQGFLSAAPQRFTAVAREFFDR